MLTAFNQVTTKVSNIGGERMIPDNTPQLIAGVILVAGFVYVVVGCLVFIIRHGGLKK